MTVTTERDPFLAIREEDVRVGDYDGLYRVPSLDPRCEWQYWLTEPIQAYDRLNLAEVIRQSGIKYDFALGMSRGGLAIVEKVSYYNNIGIVPTTQTSMYPDNSSENRSNKPIIVTRPDYAYLRGHFKRWRITRPRGVLCDDLADSLYSTELTQSDFIDGLNAKSVSIYETIGGLVEELQVDPSDIDLAVLYDKRVDRTRSDGTTPLRIVHSVRSVTSDWVDHESQADYERLAIRREHLAPYQGEIAMAAAFFAGRPADPEMMQRIVDRSAA